MKSILEDHQINQMTRPRAMSSSSANSFSFRPDPLRSHNNNLQEGVKPASRSDLVDRLNNLVDIATEMCLHMPINALHKDFMTTIMQLLMSQMQQSNSTKLLPLTFCQKRLLAINMYALNPNVTLQDRLYILKALHSHHQQWSRYVLKYCVDKIILVTLILKTFFVRNFVFSRKKSATYINDNWTILKIAILKGNSRCDTKTVLLK